MKKGTSNFDILKVIGINTVFLRKKHRITQKQLADILDISVKSLSSIEHGILPPRLEPIILHKISFFFDISFSTLSHSLIEKSKNM